MGGCRVRYAQSSGEWPGSRRTFLDERLEGARVDVDRGREEVEGASDRDGGVWRLEAAGGGV